MRRNFSEKYGYKKIRDSFQVNSIDDRLKNRIWIIIKKVVMSVSKKKDRFYDRYYFTNQKDYDYISRLYEEYFAFSFLPNKEILTLINDINEIYFRFKWYEIYDFLEVLIEFNPDNNASSVIKEALNKVFEEEMSAYRFIDDCIAPIIDEVEIKEIEEVFESKYDTVKGHLSKALELLSDRESPDYQNSIKESISAVESIVNIVIGRVNVALNKGLQSLPFEIDNNFKQGMIRLYSWTSSSDGIRHGAHEGEILSGFDEAKYMLVSCSAFINYLISKNESNKVQ